MITKSYLNRSRYTHVSEGEDWSIVRLCSTTILYKDRETLKIRFGGWYSALTARRINQGAKYLGFDLRCYRKAGEYHISYRGKDYVALPTEVVIIRPDDVFVTKG